MKVSARALLKWMGRMAREIVVEWINLGKERPERADLDGRDESEEELMPPEPPQGKSLGLEASEPLGLHEGPLTEKGFEDHVLGLFDPSEFEVLDQNNIDSVIEGNPLPIDMKGLGPDLLMRQKRTGVRFGIVLTLVRQSAPGNHLGQVKILEGYRRRRLQKYSQLFKVPCFVVVGRGTAKLDQLALIPLESVPAEGMTPKEIAGYDRDPSRPITFMELADLSALCSELTAEREEDAAVPQP